MDSRVQGLLKIADGLFSRKQTLNSLWQEYALNFYPERADFTTDRSVGAEMSSHLFTSYPVLARRELGNMMAASLRPRSHKWFSIHVDNEEVDKGVEERQFLEYVSGVQWRAMYDRHSGFVRATKEADHDFVTFGNAVIKVTVNFEGTGLSYRDYHLRDCTWMENAEGVIDCLFRKWKPTARQLTQAFPKTVHTQVTNTAKKEPAKPINCMHCVLPSRMYDYKSATGKKFPFISLYIDRDNDTILEEEGLSYFCYVVPRWQTVSGSVFGHSMATSICLPDGRTSQVVMRTLREASEKYVDPPMVAVEDAIRGDIAVYAGGITNVDMDYDERLGEVLRPITQNRGGMPIGIEVAAALREDIRSAFFMDKMQLPQSNIEMTAFEVRRRLEEHIRASSPIFEPISEEYNESLCEATFHILSESGAFPLEQMPASLSESKVRFSFRSPLADLAEQQEAETYVDLMNRIWLPAAQIDPGQLDNLDLTEATRAAALSGGWKAAWLRSIEEVREIQAARQKKQEAMQQMEMMQQAGEAAGANASTAETLQRVVNGGKA